MAKSENPMDHMLRLDMFDFDGIRRAPDFLGQVNVDLTTLYNDNPEVKATEQTWYVPVSMLLLLQALCNEDILSFRATGKHIHKVHRIHAQAPVMSLPPLVRALHALEMIM